MYRLDVGKHVRFSAQEDGSYCGPAAIQMCRDGYRKSEGRRRYSQETLYKICRAYNSNLPIDRLSFSEGTDPHGLAGCLNQLKKPKGVVWIERAKPRASRGQVLFSILHSMDKWRLPVPVMVDQGGHWVVVVGWETDKRPIRGARPRLRWIRIFDPEPPGTGTMTWLPGAQWYAGRWSRPMPGRGTWYRRFVAVVEPDEFAGMAAVSVMKRKRQRTLLGADKAISAARRVVREKQFRRWPEYSFFYRRDSMICSVEPVQEGSEYYYIVRFGLRSERSGQELPLVRGVVNVGAYNGEILEVTAYGKPGSPLTKERAINAVAAGMRIEAEKLQNVKATLMFRPCGITHTRSDPFWRVTVGRRTVYVDQRGVVYARLPLSIP